PGNHVNPDVGSRVFEMMREIAALVDSACLGMDPIDLLEEMASSGSRITCAPLIYGYVSYAIAGFRSNRLAFADVAAEGN
ncbi:MAG: carbohydrate ABC transporter substrate-binding protein, partial [Mesorhizobium sp.]